METEISYYNVTEEPVFFTTTDYAILGTGFTIISVAGTLGNLLVIIVVAVSKELQNSTNVFIVNLATADFLFSILMPLHIYSIFGEYQPFFDTMCFICLGGKHSTFGVSVWTLASIALNRYVLILSPMKYYKIIFQKKVVAVWIILLWLYPISMAIIPPVVFGIGQHTFDHTLHLCRSPTTLETTETYDTVQIYAVFSLPLIIIFICYIGIYIRVFKHNRMMKKHSLRNHSGSVTNRTCLHLMLSFSSSSNDLKSSTRRSKDEAYIRQIKITKNMFIIFCAYVICYSPHLLCDQIYGECPLDSYGRLIISFNSVVNPIIYGINHPQFRKAYIKLFKCKY
ncbi:Rhodopsin, GQ-coupled [Holothuria leucospilota]|uniref:Rhodopsin, GQ-coupled n=1 Tax=Holothuria leucospilota TaxID=206669 RepID=A0A9Q1BU81_HOLLE|nr:Rhodopsin, GQ-coupled [Holothuria leucospilota]